MEIVISSKLCFSISNEAMLLLVKKNNKHIEKVTVKQYYGKQNLKFFEADFNNEKIDDIYYGSRSNHGELTDKKYIYFYDMYSLEFRSDKDLIQIVKKLKEKSFGGNSKLKIIKIPNNIKFEIVESGCGYGEAVHEKHRVWY